MFIQNMDFFLVLTVNGTPHMRSKLHPATASSNASATRPMAAGCDTSTLMEKEREKGERGKLGLAELLTMLT